MTPRQQVKKYIDAQREPKRSDMKELHDVISALRPRCKLWFFDGKDEKGRTVSNPSIGYGTQEMKYTSGKSREFYQVGLSANTSGISVYILGLKDKKHLAQKYGKTLGKATVTGYCIRFKRLEDIDLRVLEDAICDGFGPPS